MQRRTLLQTLTTTSLGTLMASSDLFAKPSAFATLPTTPRMPVLFLGHGSPMNALEGNSYYRSWQTLGAQFGSHSGAKYPKPALIICISAHWLTRGWYVTAMPKPKTIHDFGGFPQALFDQQYPAPGAPDIAQALSATLAQPNVGLDNHEWGLDHGTWAVLKPMFPKADIPVLQLSMDYDRPPAEHFALGQQLKALRERGVLIVGSGNIVHNLRAMRPGAPAHDWALEFDRVTADHIQKGDLAALKDFAKLGPVAQMAHPSFEHYLPLLYTAGAADAKEPMRFFNETYEMASLAMRSVVWG
jgi:4,5-DOPA dioxygenase extradiol